MGIVRDLYYARKMSAGLKLPAPTVALLIKRLRLAAAMGGGVTKTVSGSPAHITDALAKAALSVLASIEPIQDLHGYSHPWPDGGGVNKFKPLEGSFNGIDFTANTNGTVHIEGQYQANSWTYVRHNYTLSELGLSVGDTVTIYSDSYTIIGFYDSDSVRISYTSSSGSFANAQIPSGTVEIQLAEYATNTATEISGTTVNKDAKFLLAKGSVSAWTPYSNICPISGLTGLSVYRTGKNLIDGSKTYQQGANQLVLGQVVAYSTRSIFLTAGTYTISVALSGGKTASIYLFTDSNPGGSSIGNTTAARSFTLASDTNVAINLYTGNGITASNLVSVQLELGSTASTYEPYNGNTYAVDWTTPAGTVYGGTVDVVTGELVVDRASVNISSSWSWNKSGSYPGGFYLSIENAGTGQKERTPFICSHAKTATSTSQYVQGTCYCDDFINIRIMEGSDTVQDWENYINAQITAGTPIQICYELATPITYQLTPQEVQMLLGENNVWSSSGDTVSVTYYAEGNANPLQSLNILLGGRYSNPKTADDVSDKEALEIILGGNK